MVMVSEVSEQFHYRFSCIFDKNPAVPGLDTPCVNFNSHFLTCSPGTKMDLSPSSEGVRSCRDMENVAEYLPEVIETARDIGEVFKIILNPRISFFLGFCR